MRKFFILICAIFVIGKITKAQDERFKALFMYNFTKYLEWPVDNQNEEFVIGVYGSSPIIQELNIIAQKKTVGNQKIVVKKINSPEELPACSILYIPENKSSKVSEIIKNCKSKGTLIITDKEGLGKTIAGINYVKVDGKQNFEINKSNIEGKGIKINSALLTLGIAIK